MSKLSILKKSNEIAASNKSVKAAAANSEYIKTLIEKDTPMPANENRRCAKCDYDVTIRYCSNCGQKIEWDSRKKDPIQPKTTPSKPMGRRKMNGGFEYD